MQIPHPPADDEEKKLIKDVEKDRRYAIDALIVRIMKRRKVLDHQQLVMECVKQLGPMFKVCNSFTSMKLSFSIMYVKCSIHWNLESYMDNGKIRVYIEEYSSDLQSIPVYQDSIHMKDKLYKILSPFKKEVVLSGFQ